VIHKKITTTLAIALPTGMVVWEHIGDCTTIPLALEYYTLLISKRNIILSVSSAQDVPHKIHTTETHPKYLPEIQNANGHRANVTNVDPGAF
jgi:hypothetical protein